MITRPLLTGLILAGGNAARMQGLGRQGTINNDRRGPPGGGDAIDKGLLELNGLPLVALASNYLRPRVGSLMISANRHPDIYGRYGRVIADDPVLGRDAGPLAGVASAMAEMDTPWLMVIPVDVPVLPPDLIQRLARAAMAGPAKITYANTTRAHPLCMLVHRDLLAGLHVFLQAAGRKVQCWQQLNHAEPVFFNEDDHAFFNINSPVDLCVARQRFKP